MTSDDTQDGRRPRRRPGAFRLDEAGMQPERAPEAEAATPSRTPRAIENIAKIRLDPEDAIEREAIAVLDDEPAARRKRRFSFGKLFLAALGLLISLGIGLAVDALVRDRRRLPLLRVDEDALARQPQHAARLLAVGVVLEDLDPLHHQINGLIHEHINLFESRQPIFKVLNALQSQPIARFIQCLNPAALANRHQMRWVFCCRRTFAVSLEEQVIVHPVRLGQTLKIDRFKPLEHSRILLGPLGKGRS